MFSNLNLRLNYTDITEDGLAGVINIGGYVRDNDWNAALDR